MRYIETALHYLQYAMGVVLLAGVGLNFLNVILRYCFGSPYAWAEEVMVFGLIFLVMAGTVVATAFDKHLKVDIVTQLAPIAWQRAVKIAGLGLWVVVSLYLATQSYTVVTLVMRLGQRSMAARIPTWLPHSFLLCAFVLSAVAGVYAMLRELRRPVADEAAPPFSGDVAPAVDEGRAGE